MIRLRWRLRLRRATQEGGLAGERVWRLRWGWPNLPELGERWRDLATCVAAIVLACAPWLFAAVASADTAADPAERPAPEFNLSKPLIQLDPYLIPTPPPASQPPPSTPSVEPSPTVTTQGVFYEVPFSTGSAEITSQGEVILSRVADTMRYYPLDRLQVVGYASDDEGDDMAEFRAQAARTRLIERYHLSPSIISVGSRRTGSGAPKVEVYIVEGVR